MGCIWIHIRRWTHGVGRGGRSSLSGLCKSECVHVLFQPVLLKDVFLEHSSHVLFSVLVDLLSSILLIKETACAPSIG